MVKVDTITFLLCFSGINRIYVQKSTYILFLKVLHVTNFTMINERMIHFLQEYTIITWQTKLLLIFKNSNVTACYPVYP